MALSTKDLFRAARERAADGEPVAMTTVVATRGSTPQKAGARMLIFADGQMLGTIGGGCIEAEVWAEATRLLKRGDSALKEFVLADDPDHPGGDVCGGTMEVFIDVLKPASVAAKTGAGDATLSAARSAA
ncbi:MAG: XdhC family protein [Chloroflexi bacterium]|nr:XdhC family protein [Chloroflexota bacterium]